MRLLKEMTFANGTGAPFPRLAAKCTCKLVGIGMLVPNQPRCGLLAQAQLLRYCFGSFAPAKVRAMLNSYRNGASRSSPFDHYDARAELDSWMKTLPQPWTVALDLMISPLCASPVGQLQRTSPLVPTTYPKNIPESCGNPFWGVPSSID
ncbi:MAG: hypothetical protein ACJ746_03730 [Bryobacteraceae bacterium]